MRIGNATEKWKARALQSEWKVSTADFADDADVGKNLCNRRNLRMSRLLELQDQEGLGQVGDGAVGGGKVSAGVGLIGGDARPVGQRQGQVG